MVRCAPVTRLEEIAAAVATFYRVPVAELRGRRRPGHIAGPRMVAMYVSRRLTGATLEAIGEFYERDHTTVSHAVREVDRSLDAATELAEQVACIERGLRLRAGTPPA